EERLDVVKLVRKLGVYEILQSLNQSQASFKFVQDQRCAVSTPPAHYVVPRVDVIRRALLKLLQKIVACFRRLHVCENRSSTSQVPLTDGWALFLNLINELRHLLTRDSSHLPKRTLGLLKSHLFALLPVCRLKLV